MASAWGNSWGSAWGNSWGIRSSEQTSVVPSGGVPSTYSERRSLRARLRKAKELVEEAQELVARVTPATVFKSSTQAVVVSRGLRDVVDELEDIQAMLREIADRAAVASMLEQIDSALRAATAQIEELDIVFVACIIAA